MSLTQLLNISEVKQALAENFRRPAFPQVTPNLVAPSQAQDPSLAGIAFDYLFRSEIYDRLRLNSRKYFGRSIDADWFGVLPMTTPSELDSKHSLRVIDFVPIAGFGLRMLNNSAAVSDALKNQANAVYDTVTQAEIRNSYVSDEKLTLWERTENYLRLAKFDQVYRAGYVHDDFEKNNQDNTEDMLKIFQNVNFDRFTPHICCLLNPSLKAVGSFGGADADLVFDDVLIDLKTSTEFKLTSRDLNQLIGYLVLSRLGGFSGAKNTPQIRRLGIYFARYAYLYTFSVDELTTEDNLNTFCKWFKKSFSCKSVGNLARPLARSLTIPMINLSSK